MLNRLWSFCRLVRSSPDGLRNHRRRRLHVESLENRAVLAADLAADFVSTPLTDWAVPGQSLSVSAQVSNSGDVAAGSYRVEFRLSTDAAITAADLLLGSVVQGGLAAGESASLTPSLTIPATAAKGQYFVGIQVVADAPSSDANAANNTAVEATATPIYLTTLTGTVSYNGVAKSVAIRSHLGGVTPIFDDRSTWIVIHGRNSSPSASYLVELAASLDGFSAADQVLVVDWSAAAASGAIGGNGENYILPVGTWIASTLAGSGGYGLAPANLNLVGHSWGAYVAAEAAERVPTAKVNSLVALDPAVDYPGGSYSPTASGQVDFARNSRLSWALFANGGGFGTATTAKTAHEAIVVNGSDHTKVVSVFADIVRMNYDGRQSGGATAGIASNLNLQRLLNGNLNATWVVNAYNNTGRRALLGGVFEAAIEASSSGTTVKTFRYLASANRREVVLTV